MAQYLTFPGAILKGGLSTMNRTPYLFDLGIKSYGKSVKGLTRVKLTNGRILYLNLNPSPADDDDYPPQARFSPYDQHKP